MYDRKEISLQRLFMVQAIDLFQEAFMPYVLDSMRAHFGEQLNPHLRGLAKLDKSPIFVDFGDGQPRPDFLALIHLMTRDGGLRANQTDYTPVIFAPTNTTIDGVRPACVPSFKELRLIRLRRNALNHQGALTGEMIIDSIERITRMVAMLPEPYQSAERNMQLQLLLARAQSSEFEHQLTLMQHQQHQQQRAQERQELLSIQQERLAIHAQQLELVEQSVNVQHDELARAQQLLIEVQQQVQHMVRDQQLLVSGTAEAVVDVRNQIEAQIAQLQQLIVALQQRQSPDTKTLYTIERLQRELAAQQQITADMRIELNRMHERVDALRSAPLSPPTRIPWGWMIVVGLLGLLSWLWYSGWLMWGIWQIQPLISTVWP
jgi:hypothetical protein